MMHFARWLALDGYTLVDAIEDGAALAALGLTLACLGLIGALIVGA